MTPILEVDEFIFQLNKENERANIVRKEEKNKHNYKFLGKDGGKNHQPICRW